ncbi:MAG: MFS transporter [Proteobacteria bacterium]|nr:MFS transporter [Pseudomonadota bacterium]
MTDPSVPSPPPVRAWSIWALGAIFVAFGFFERLAPSVMTGDLMREFAVGAAVLGNLTAIAFYTYAGLQIPIGILIDRLGPRRVLTGAMLVMGAGSALFALAQSLGPAYVGRFLIGMGAGVGFVGTLKLVAHWFPPRRFAFVSGLTMMVSMIGGVGGQTALAGVVGALGWRQALLAATLFSLAFAVVLWLVVRDRPPGGRAEVAGPVRVGSLLADLRVVLRSGQNWIIAFQGGAIYAPTVAFGGLWGVPYLEKLHGLARAEAAALAAVLLLGSAVGAPACGWISDALGRRKAPIVGASIVALAGWAALLYLPGLGIAATGALLAVIGTANGGIIISYALARELGPLRVSGAATAFVNMAVVGAGSLLQPLVGLVLDAVWDGTLVEGGRSYSIAAYHAAFHALALSALAALASALLLRDSYCRPLESASATAPAGGTGHQAAPSTPARS